MKPCPYCAEEIQQEAIKCRFCGEFLEETTAGTLKTPEGKGPELSFTLTARRG